MIVILRTENNQPRRSRDNNKLPSPNDMQPHKWRGARGLCAEGMVKQDGNISLPHGTKLPRGSPPNIKYTLLQIINVITFTDKICCVEGWLNPACVDIAIRNKTYRTKSGGVIHTPRFTHSLHDFLCDAK